MIIEWSSTECHKPKPKHCNCLDPIKILALTPREKIELEVPHISLKTDVLG